MNIEIRPQMVKDAQRFYEILNNDSFVFFDSRPKSVEEQIEYIESSNKNKYQINFSILCDDLVVGGIGIKLSPHREYIGEIGYVIDENYSGKGIATKAVLLVMNYCINNTSIKRVEIICDKNHIASQKIALKSGFEKVGEVKSGLKCFGKFVDAILYSKVLE